MAEQSTLDYLGLRLGILGSSSNLAIAAPSLASPYDTTTQTYVDRIGIYFDRTAAAECLGIVVMGTESLRVLATGVRIFGNLGMDTQVANTVFAAPSGAPGAPVFRTLVAADLPATAVAAGSYGAAATVPTFTVDAAGRLTAAANVAIAIDAAAVTSGLLSVARGGTGINGSSAANGTVLIGNGTGYTLTTLTAGSGVTIGNTAGAITINATGTGGTVTSVALAGPAEVTISGSPVTSTGTLTFAWASAAANTVFAGPNAGPGTPAFRSLLAADLPVTTVTAGTYGLAGSVATFSVDAQGRLTAASTLAIVITASQVSDFDTAVRTNRLDQMAAPLGSVSFNSQLLINVLNPVSPQDGATKSYVDSVAAGLAPKAPAQLATAAVLPNTPVYANGASGVGATLTAGSFGALSVDGVAVSTNDRILVKNQAAALQNGLYTVTATGSAGTSYVLTRAGDFDQPTDIPGAFFFVESGSTLADTGWVCTTDAPVTVGVTSISFVQFSSAGAYSAGSGLTLTGNTFSVNVDNTSTIITGNNVIVKDSGITNGKIANGTIDLTTKVTGALPAANGGTGINGSTAANGTLLIGNGTGYTLATLTAGAGITIGNTSGAITITNSTMGTVTSVALAGPAEVTISGSPVTTTGTLTFAWASAAANTVFAGINGMAGTPAFRSLVAADLPNTAVTAASYGSASAVATFTVDGQGRLTAAATVSIAIAASQITSGQLSVARGGTGLDGSTAGNGALLIGNGTGFSLATLTAGNGVTITNGAGSIMIAASAATSVALASGANTVSSFIVDTYFGAVFEVCVNDDAGASYTSILTVNHDGTTGADANVTNWTESNEVVTGATGVAFTCTLTGSGGTQAVNLIATASGTGRTLRWTRRLY